MHDDMTNGAGNIVKKIHLNHKDKPSGIIWVQFDHLQSVPKKNGVQLQSLIIQR